MRAPRVKPVDQANPLEAIVDQQHGALPGRAQDGLAQFLRALAIQVSGRAVEDEYVRACEQRPR